MKRTRLIALLGGAFFAAIGGRAAGPAAESTALTISWQQWSPQVFQRAQAEHRLVLLDLEAVWCHWCHVMDGTTYHDPAVVREIGDHFLAVRVDQDARPDLSNRYGDYGWPATILFAPGGRELAKRQGYLPPREMESMLKAFVQDPTPGPSVVAEAKIEAGAALTAAQRAELEKKLDNNYDTKAGGWGFGNKFLEWNSVEYALGQARRGDTVAAQRARATLAAQVRLIDRVWGGVDQYSTNGDWAHPHFEKLAQFQAENMRIYALAAAQWPESGYLDHARAIERFVDRFLTSPDGAFYVSQDADLVDGQHSAGYFALDDAARRKLGVPRVDTHLYARENGWMISGLVALANVTHDTATLAKAVRAAGWVQQNRALPDGGFRHDTSDVAGPYLSDTLAMGQAFLALYGATGDRSWLAKAQQAADFIEKTFRARVDGPIAVGYVTSAAPAGTVLTPKPLSDENVELARFANLLGHYTGLPRDHAMATFALSYLASSAGIRADGNWTAGLLLADAECAVAPLHVVVVGPKDDAAAGQLFATARALPGAYKMTEWLDRRKGPLPAAGVDYPQLPVATAFLCGVSNCSRPLQSVQELVQFVSKQAATR